MNAKVKAALESYARSFIVAAIAVYSAGETDLKAIVIVGLAAVVGPAIRAANPKDPAFGIIADTVEAEIKALVKKSKKKVK
jgi:hypothetical protein